MNLSIRALFFIHVQLLQSCE